MRFSRWQDGDSNNSTGKSQEISDCIEHQNSGPIAIVDSAQNHVQPKPSSINANHFASPKKHRFKTLGNLDGDSDVPQEELDALSVYIYQSIAGDY